MLYGGNEGDEELYGREQEEVGEEGRDGGKCCLTYRRGKNEV